MTAWKIIEADGDREWPKDNRAEVEEALNNFSDWELEVESPTGQTLSRQEFLGEATDNSQEPEIVEEAQAIVEPEEPNSDETEPPMSAENVEENIEERMAEGYQQVSQELPDTQPGVDTDPLEWVPGDFVDNIDGTPAINRKGYDVLAHHYNISVTTEVLVSPKDTDYTYAEVKATATTENGVEYSAHGSAHTSRNDDEYLLLEMADTRAAKRATARATGVGMVAVSELQNDLRGE